METLFAVFVKLLVIFIGCGIGTLLAYWIGNETSTIPGLILNSYKTGNEKLKLEKYNKVVLGSGIYEVSVPGRKTLKLFSSDKGIKIV